VYNTCIHNHTVNYTVSTRALHKDYFYFDPSDSLFTVSVTSLQIRFKVGAGPGEE